MSEKSEYQSASSAIPWRKTVLVFCSILLSATLFAPVAPASATSRANYFMQHTGVCGYKVVETVGKEAARRVSPLKPGGRSEDVVQQYIYVMKVRTGGVKPFPLCESVKDEIFERRQLELLESNSRYEITPLNMVNCAASGKRVGYQRNICQWGTTVTKRSDISKRSILRADGNIFFKLAPDGNRAHDFRRDTEA